MDIRAFLYENSDVLKGVSKQSKRGWNGSRGKKSDRVKGPFISERFSGVKAIYRSIAAIPIPIVGNSENTRQNIGR